MNDIVLNSNKCTKIKQFGVYDKFNKGIINVIDNYDIAVNELDKIISGEILERNVYYTEFRRMEN